MKTLAVILLIIQLALQLLDVYTTKKILSLGGREANPVIKGLIDRFGIKKALAIKFFMAAGLGLYFAINNYQYLIILNLLYIAIVIWNYSVIRKLK